MDWQVERLRLTAFINHKADPEDYKVWKDIFDEHPDESVILRKEQRLQEQGAFNGHHLIMQLQPFRFDWIFLKEKNADDESDETDPSPEFPFVGSFDDDLILPFRDLAIRWLDGSSLIDRLAFGAILLSPVEVHEDGYEILDGMLPDVRVDRTARDFLFQVNRRRPTSSGVDGLDINRLTKWSVARLFDASVSLSQSAMRSSTRSGSSACRLELDMNTADEFAGSLPDSKLSQIFTELIDFAIEIADQGDIA